MKSSIFKFVFFSIIISSFEYAQNELYFVNERSINLERNITNFRNNRILADTDNRFDLNNFYESTLSLINKINDDNDDDEEITKLKSIMNLQLMKSKESNTLKDLNNVDKKTKKYVLKLQKELEGLKKELDDTNNDDKKVDDKNNDNKNNDDENNDDKNNDDKNNDNKNNYDELAIKREHGKHLIEKNGHFYLSDVPEFKPMSNEGILVAKEHQEIISYINNERSTTRKLRKERTKLIKKVILLIGVCVTGLMTGMALPFLIFISIISFETAKKMWKIFRLSMKTWRTKNHSISE
ncbi:hypothetical protein YYC_05798 [Plasmodium yoelii 17X]|uniref:Fam-b protein n=3 Tax=Plasmodium yoelii TaxID=5861 RepID=A0AAE9WTA0_PLAYO|nr:hypothetical protein [Plasmodium yoelii yoelii]ETB56369.1 hypothetical protein YYC_05798 [Plasmodium yoelii 17X]WBY59681.1 fam-b protein [Plasmodium yoelii yoelii]